MLNPQKGTFDRKPGNSTCYLRVILFHEVALRDLQRKNTSEMLLDFWQIQGESKHGVSDWEYSVNVHRSDLQYIHTKNIETCEQKTKFVVSIPRCKANNQQLGLYFLRPTKNTSPKP